MNAARIAAFCVIVAGCAEVDTGTVAELPDPVPVWNEQTAWTLSDAPSVVISAPPPRERAEGSPLDPVHVFRTGDGRYVVADGGVAGWQALLVYDSAGGFLQRLGRKGDGPAEFRQITGWAGNVAGDSIAGYDNALRRLQIWSADGRFGRTLSFGAYGVEMLADGRFIMRTVPQISAEQWRRRRDTISVSFDLHDSDGSFVRRMATKQYDLADEPTGPDAPNYSNRQIIATGSAHLYLAENREFSVHVYDTLGTHVHTLRRTLPREPFTDEDREEAILLRLEWAGFGPEAANPGQMSELEKGLRRDARWPEYRPLIQDVVEDADGNVWVQHYLFLFWPTADPPLPRPITWSVFDPAGRFLGEVIVPDGFRIRTITGDQVLGIRRDESNAEHVHVYDLHKPAG